MALAALCAGCAALPIDSASIPHPSSRAQRAVQSGYSEAVGVIHVHSTYSDGSLPIEEIARIAGAQELDYLIVTDHDTLQGKRDGKEKRYGKTWVLIGAEITTEGGGHYLAVGVDQEIPRNMNPRWTVEMVSSEGGMGFIAHPFWPRKPWRDLEVSGMTGIEIYSAKEDAVEENTLWLGLWTVLTGSDFSMTKWLDRPDQPLALWDRLLARGDRVVGIGSPDAHGLKRWGLRLAPYAAMFKIVRNHLLVKSDAPTPEAVYEALGRGRLFVAHDAVADARGFRFAAVRGNSVLGVMGEEVKWGEGLTLYAYLPSPGEAALFKDGKRWAEGKGQNLWFECPGPGVYRLEAAHEETPWIYSNPIYVLE